jgi:Sulfotransferase domain
MRRESAARPLRLRLSLAGLAGLERLRELWTLRHQKAQVAAALELPLPPQEDDIFVVGYPRSGATLVQAMLLELTGAGDFLHIASRSPRIDVELLRGKASFIESLPSPRILRSLRRREELPRKGRFIYIARDLYDVAVSAFHYVSLVEGYDPDPGDFFRRFPEGHAVASLSWCEHLRSWWPHRDDPDVLFLAYDEVVGDLDGAIRRVAAFCGIALDEGRMPQLRERCGIDFMKRHAKAFDPRLRRIDEQPSAFIRRGGSGSGVRELSPEHRRSFAAPLQALARRLAVDPGEPLASLFGRGTGSPDRAGAAAR